MHKILVVVDAQHDFIDGTLGSEEAKNIILPNLVGRIKEAINDDNEKIIFTRDTHDENYLNTSEGRKLPIVHCIKHTHGWELHDDITSLKLPINKFSITNKDTFGSLENRRLNDFKLPAYIKSYSNDESELEIEFCGFCTDICVIVNALICKTIFPDAKIIVNAKCCHGTSKEAHEAALLVMKSCQIDIIE